MEKYDKFNEQLIGFSIPVGAFSGLIASVVAGLELPSIIGQGTAGGILTAGLISIIINRFEIEYNILKLFVAGIFSGAMAGFWIGLLTAWTINGSYLYGALIGSGIGLVGGILLILLTHHFSKRK